MTAELPDIDERFAAGEFAPLREWLAENVHHVGRRHLTTEMLERVVGGGLDPAPTWPTSRPRSMHQHS